MIHEVDVLAARMEAEHGGNCPQGALNWERGASCEDRCRPGLISDCWRVWAGQEMDKDNGEGR